MESIAGFGTETDKCINCFSLITGFIILRFSKYFTILAPNFLALRSLPVLKQTRSNLKDPSMHVCDGLTFLVGFKTKHDGTLSGKTDSDVTTNTRINFFRIIYMCVFI